MAWSRMVAVDTVRSGQILAVLGAELIGFVIDWRWERA